MSSTPTGWEPDGDERTQVLPTQPAPAPDSTRVQPAAAPPPPGRPHPYETRPAPREQDVARRDPRGTPEWDLQVARLHNRPLTDVGLLVLRLLSVPLVLHGVHKAAGFAGFVETVRSNPFGAMAPEVFAGLVVAGQLALPVLLALGFATRFAALAQAAMMASIYALWVLASSPVIDPRTGGLSGEAALAFAALALPLVFTGPGRFSLDHALGGARRERRVERRAARSLGAR